MKKLFIFFFLVAALFIAHPLQSVSAATQTVNTLDDTDDGICDATHCSLREAIHYATAGDTIDFSVTGTLMLSGTELSIDKSLTIAGPGENLLTISANTASPSNASRVIYVHSDSSTLVVSISGLSITNGYGSTGQGGGIYNDGENLTITNCLISHNSSKKEGGGIHNNGILTIDYSTIASNATTGGAGGGIHNEGTLVINNSSVSGNSAVGGPGGGVFNAGTMTIDNSTIFDNHADSNRYWGGGIGNEGALTITNSTISANSADSSGAGLRHKGDSLTLANTLIANNIGAGDCQKDESSIFIDEGYNLIEGTGNFACDLIDGVNGNIIGQDPALANDLGDYGGPTPTLPILFSSSPAWDAIPDGVNNCHAGNSTDQRGEVRAGGTDSTGYFACDIGAFEFGSGEGFTLNLIFLPLTIK